MRTNIEIDDNLLEQAMRASHSVTKKATVEAALRQMVQLKRQERIRRWFGKIKWEGDLKVMRASRFQFGQGRAARQEGARKETKRTPAPKPAAAD